MKPNASCSVEAVNRRTATLVGNLTTVYTWCLVEFESVGPTESLSDRSRTAVCPSIVNEIWRLHFYEKVVKVKADVAALHIFSHNKISALWTNVLR
jgi:hypothetical protein